VLQRVAWHAAMLQCSVMCCSVLQCVAWHAAVLQCIAMCCSVLQCVAVCRDMFQRQDYNAELTKLKATKQRHHHQLSILRTCVAVCCSVLQRVAICCGVLQCVAVHCV